MPDDDKANNNDNVGEDSSNSPVNDSGAPAQEEANNEHTPPQEATMTQGGTLEDEAASLQPSWGDLSQQQQQQQQDPSQQEDIEAEVNAQQQFASTSWNMPQHPTARTHVEWHDETTSLPPEVVEQRSHDAIASSIQNQYHPSAMMRPPESLLVGSGDVEGMLLSSSQQQNPVFAPAPHYLQLPATAGSLAGNPLAGAVGYAGGMVPPVMTAPGPDLHLPNTGFFNAQQHYSAAAGSYPQTFFSQQLYQQQLFFQYQQQVAASSAMLQRHQHQPTPFAVASVGEALMTPQESLVGNQPSSNIAYPTDSHSSLSRKRSHSASSRRGSNMRNSNKPEGFGALAERVNDKLAERKPKRPLSAYNIFFKDERARLLQNNTMTGGEGSVNEDVKPAAEDDNNASVRTTDTPHGTETAATATSESTSEATKRNQRGKPPHKKIGFEAMAKTISKRWKEIRPEQLADCQRRAEADKKRYQAEMSLYKEKRRNALEATRETLEASVPEAVRNDYLNRN